MSSYNYEYFVRDFASRTMQNLELYRGTYEVTQLINSMLGLIIIPFELYSFRGRLNEEEEILSQTSYYRDIQNAIIKLMGQGRLKFDRYLATKDNLPKVTPLLSCLRNCLAHPGNGIRFFPVAEGADDSITDVYFIYEASPKSFALKIKIDELQQLVCDIAKMYAEAEPHLKVSAVTREYSKQIDWADKFLKGNLKK